MSEEEVSAAEYDADQLAAQLVTAVRRIAELEAERVVRDSERLQPRGATVSVERAVVIVILVLLCLFVVVTLF